MVIAITTVVKNDECAVSDNGRCRWQGPVVKKDRDEAISGLAERIEECVRLADKSERAVSEAIGFEGPQLAMTRARLKKSPGAGVDVRIVVGLARLAGVSVDWLCTGQGQKQTCASEPVDRARSAATALGYAAEVIEQGIGEARPGEDARAVFWRIQSAEASPLAPGTGLVAKDKGAPEGDISKAATRAIKRGDEEAVSKKTRAK